MNAEKVIEYLDIEIPSLSVSEVKDWMKEIWFIERPISGIPVVRGLSCNLCHYSAGNQDIMKNHFSKCHQGSKWSECTKECKVQMLFKGQFKKCILLL